MVDVGLDLGGFSSIPFFLASSGGIIERHEGDKSHCVCSGFLKGRRLMARSEEILSLVSRKRMIFLQMYPDPGSHQLFLLHDPIMVTHWAPEIDFQAQLN
jgi:hypothetical protein